MYYIIWYHNYHISISILHSLLVFAQRQSNQRLAFFMVFSFYIECILGNSLLFLLYKPNFDIGYWISTAHPFSRIPVFFMGVCAGVLCMRIKEQDFDAMNCKLLSVFFISYLMLIFHKVLVDLITLEHFHLLRMFFYPYHAFQRKFATKGLMMKNMSNVL